MMMETGSNTVTIPFKGFNLRGIKLNSMNGMEYYGFLGIPYAKPPIGDLRFMPPQPIESYTENIDATYRRDVSIQKRSISDKHRETFSGSEDCLYLNVFIPKLPRRSQKLKDVMIHVSGGGYIRTSLSIENPDGLIEHDVIFVYVTYRLHILGLFNKVIASSGDASSMWGLVNNPVECAINFGNCLGFKGTDKKELLTFFKSLSAKDLLDGIFKNKNLPCVTKTEQLWSVYMFRPSIEYIKEGALLPKSPRELWKDVNHISILSGICVNEGSFFFHNKNSLDEYFDRNHVKNTMKIFVDDCFKLDSDNNSKLLGEIEKFYFEKENTTLDIFVQFINFCTDLMMRDYYTIFNFMRKPEINSTFNYLFSCKTPLNHKPRLPLPLQGTLHSDEYSYTMITTAENTDFYKDALPFSRMVCSLWTNFAKTGNPNGNEIGIHWESSSVDRPCYLRIDKNIQMILGDINEDRVKFWRYLYNKYSL
ncbi:hypothetical protein PGB90_008750 [Kerria lacca]